MKTLVIGATTNKERYSYKAIHNLVGKSHQVVAIGAKKGMALDITIETEKIPFKGVDTVTLYINPTVQREYYDYIISLQPRRVIFNPGTENPEFYTLLDENNIQYEVACTLVLLATNQY
ncbi:MAG: CoA-binding protein [Flavobacterium sp.]|uniref:CoA-binding protein n=1 Tax=unclassified Flavobacterium TaxID=196869 RepID=UPI000C4AD2E4|nr:MULTISPECIES: CoA-binding protein [unclassified Flavobacterium]MBF02142.1 CoA-binding protein [Flavobacterium sp.]MCO6164238.1 CoA-binding protein [Flavobacterium sp. NRK F7]|tara:strand:+ start:222 stop:578 length:357 start_codon:yes stop_codon:yes gene_type:complete